MPKLLQKAIMQSVRKMRNNDILVGSVAGLIVKMFAACSAFFMNLIIARQLGVSEAGLFFLGFTLITLISAIGRVGLDNSVVRFISRSMASGDSAAVHAVYRKSIAWAGWFSLILASALIVLHKIFPNSIFNGLGLEPVLIVLSIAIPFVSLYTIHAQSLKALGKVVQGLSTLNLLVPTIFVFGVLYYPIRTAEQAATIYVGATIGATLIGAYWWASHVPKSCSYVSFSARTLRASCIPLWGVTILQQIIQWSPQLTMGAWSSSEDVALLATAQRTAMLTSFVLVAVNAVVAPKFAALSNIDDLDQLRNVTWAASRLMTAAATPILLMMIIFPAHIMGLFGSGFREAGILLVILAVGQFINVVTGSTTFLLSMTGHERHLRLNMFIGAGLIILLCAILVPLYGAIGGAIASAVAIVLQNILAVIQVRRLLGFCMLSFWRRA